jgi:hypothetical protein
VDALFRAGLQLPVIPLMEVVGRAVIAEPSQNGPTGANVGSTWSVIDMVRVAVVAHWPSSGVKVYSVVAALLIAGLHAPVIPLLEVVGRAAIEAPAQNGPTASNVGVMF